MQNFCVINWTQHRDPSPCDRVFLADAKTSDSGYAILADPGVADETTNEWDALATRRKTLATTLRGLDAVEARAR